MLALGETFLGGAMLSLHESEFSFSDIVGFRGFPFHDS